MQAVVDELPGVINELLQSPPHRLRSLVERHFTPGCRLTHALVIAENREDIIRVFQFWRFFNAKNSVKVHEISEFTQTQEAAVVFVCGGIDIRMEATHLPPYSNAWFF